MTTHDVVSLVLVIILMVIAVVALRLERAKRNQPLHRLRVALSLLVLAVGVTYILLLPIW